MKKELARKVYHNLSLSESELKKLQEIQRQIEADPDFENDHSDIERALKLKLEVFKCFPVQLNTRRELKLIQNFKKILGISIFIIFLIWMFI